MRTRTSFTFNEREQIMKKLNYARIAGFLLLGTILFAGSSYAKSAKEINANVETALDLFKAKVSGGKDMLAKAKGVLVLAPVYRGGIGIGAEYGTGALLINGKTEDYYNIISGSFGFQFGGQKKNMYLLFMQEKALQDFRKSEGWRVGADGSVALIDVGADGSIDTTKANAPIVAMVLGQKGLMFNLTLEGAKFNKIKPD